MKKKKYTIILLVIIVVVIICSLLLYKFIFGKSETFQCRLLEINGNILTVEAVEDNNSIFVGEFIFEITDKTKIVYLDKETDLDSIVNIHPHSLLEITFSGKVSKTSPAKIKNIKKIEFVIDASNIAIMVYLENDVIIEDIERIKEELQNIGGITSITFESKEEIKERMIEENETFKEIFSDMDDNPLRDTFTIHINDFNKKEQVVQAIEQIDKVDIVKY